MKLCQIHELCFAHFKWISKNSWVIFKAELGQKGTKPAVELNWPRKCLYLTQLKVQTQKNPTLVGFVSFLPNTGVENNPTFFKSTVNIAGISKKQM